MGPTSSSNSLECFSPASYQPTLEGKQKNPDFIQLPFHIPDEVLTRIFEFAPSILPILNKVRLLTKNSSYSLSKLDWAINGYLKGTKSKCIDEIPKFESVKQLRSFLEVYGKNVRHLDLSVYKPSKDDKSLNDDDVSELLTLAPNVEELNLSGLLITGLCFRCKKLSQLKILSVSGCALLGDETLRRGGFGSGENLRFLDAPCLEELNIRDMSMYMSYSSFSWGSAFSQLKRLSLSGYHGLADGNLNHLNAPCLEELNLTNMNVTGSFWEGKEFLQLKRLSLNRCSEIKDENLRRLNAPYLEELNLSQPGHYDQSITGSFLKGKEFLQLKRLNLSGHCRFTDENLNHLNTPCLEELSLSYMDITGSFLEGKAFSQLKRFSLSSCNRLLEGNLNHLNALCLEELNFRQMTLSGLLLKDKAFPRLRRLSLGVYHFRDENLIFLNASCLEELKVTCGIGVRWVEHKEFPQLKRLIIEPHVSDRELESLNASLLKILVKEDWQRC